jgi:hypothetical protein
VLLPQIDVGPAGWTGRGIDISKGALEKFGYTPENFPTDSHFSHKPAPVPQSSVASPKSKTADTAAAKPFDPETDPL